LFLIGLTVFAGGSVGAAFSGSVSQLIAWRGVMGAGAALTMPATLSIINDLFRDPRERTRAIGLWAGTSGIGIAIGPIAGGVLLAHFWWGSVFFVNLPIVIAGAIGALLVVPDSKNPDAARPDPVGGMLSILAFGCILWAIIDAPTRGWTSARVIEVGVVGLAVLAAFVAWETHIDHPMLNFSLFRSRRFSAATSSLSLGVFGLFGALFVQTQFLQFDLGLTAIQAGVRILPIAAVVAIAAPFSTVIIRSVGSKVTASAGLLSIAGGLLQLSLVASSTTTYAQVVPGMLLIGLGAGLVMPTATDAVIGSVPRGDAGVGSATNGVSIQLGGAMGVAVIGSSLSSRYRDHLSTVMALQHVPAFIARAALGSIGGAIDIARRLPGSAGAQLMHAAGTAFMSGVGLSLAIGAGVATAGFIVALLALPSRPSHPPGGRDADAPRGVDARRAKDASPAADPIAASAWTR
jgi:hypothetical protein